MTRLLHTRSKIFLTNPYVIRIEYGSDLPLDHSEADYRKLMRRAYKLISGTWGYTTLEYEELTPSPLAGKWPPHVAQTPVFGANNLIPIFGAMLMPQWVHVARAYVCFKDEDDALQFNLMSGAKAMRAHMWPSNRFFTIHEVVVE